MKKISLPELYSLIKTSRPGQEQQLLMTVCFDFTDVKASQHFNASFVEDAIHLSVHSMHGAVGSLLFPLNLQSVNLYNRTAKLLLGDISTFDSLWTALTICEPVKQVRYKLSLKELHIPEPVKD